MSITMFFTTIMSTHRLAMPMDRNASAITPFLGAMDGLQYKMIERDIVTLPDGQWAFSL